jgi:hypothetical protein
MTRGVHHCSFGQSCLLGWDDLDLVIAWRQFMREPRSYFLHFFDEC